MSSALLILMEQDADSTKTAAKPAEHQPYISQITKEENTITLKGLVPSEGDLKILQGVAAATSPGAALVDKTKANANVPDRDTWLAAMTFALRQLAKLDTGTVFLSDASIAIDGVTKADDDFSAIQKKVKDEVPKGLALQISLRRAEVRLYFRVEAPVPDGIRALRKSKFTIPDLKGKADISPSSPFQAQAFVLDLQDDHPPGESLCPEIGGDP